METTKETQHAVCKIVTEELQATANVSLTRELKGVCTSGEQKKLTYLVKKKYFRYFR